MPRSSILIILLGIFAVTMATILFQLGVLNSFHLAIKVPLFMIVVLSIPFFALNLIREYGMRNGKFHVLFLISFVIIYPAIWLSRLFWIVIYDNFGKVKWLIHEVIYALVVVAIFSWIVVGVYNWRLKTKDRNEDKKIDTF